MELENAGIASVAHSQRNAALSSFARSRRPTGVGLCAVSRIKAEYVFTHIVRFRIVMRSAILQWMAAMRAQIFNYVAY